MNHTLLASLLALLTACSTTPVPAPPPDITEERLHLHLADSCKLVKEPDGLWLHCDGDPKFMVNDDCVIEIENNDRYLNCSE